MNRGQLRARLALRLRLPPTGDPLLDEPTLNDMLAQALLDVSSVKDWPWLLTSASLTFTAGSAPIPATCVKLRDLMVNGWRARPSELAEYLDQATYQTMFMWTNIGSNIVLNPAPAASPTNTLYFIQGEPALTLDTSVPLIPEAHQGAVVIRAAHLSEVHRGRADAAMFHDSEFEKSMKWMHDATKRSNRPRQVREAGYQRWASW